MVRASMKRHTARVGAALWRRRCGEVAETQERPAFDASLEMGRSAGESTARTDGLSANEKLGTKK